MATLGETIRARREELGLTQEQLAERIGENARQADISRLEHDGVTLPRRERLEGLAAALDLDLGVLLSRSGWVGADRVISSAEPAVEPNPVELEDVLEKAKEVVIHLQDLVEAAEGTLPDEDGSPVEAAQPA